jgi:hypothetical protein
MLEQRKWVFHVEFARLLTTSLLVWSYFPYDSLIALLVVCLFMLVNFYEGARNYYYELVYSGPGKDS